MKKIFKILFILLFCFCLQAMSFAEMPLAQVSLLKQKGFDAYNKKDYKSAIQYLLSVPKDQHTLDMVICVANSYESLGDARSAAMLLESLNRHNPGNYTAFYNLGNIYLKAKVHKNAIESYKTCTSLNGKYAPAYYNMGIAYYELNDYNKALFYFEKAIRLNPSNKDYIYNAGVCLEAMGNKKEAEEYFKKAN